ncbi:MAG: EAL domain-containing protein [Geobacter sp.]|nr:EAL domain-containing protein [Geobacter sp.]
MLENLFLTWWVLVSTCLAILLLIFAIRRSCAIRTACQDAALLQNILDAIPAPTFYKDVNGHYIGCNQAFLRMIGRDRAEVIGKTVFEIAPPDLATVYHRADLELLARGGVQVYETKVLFDDNQHRDIMFHKAVFEGADGAPAGLAGTMLDITERNRYLERLEHQANHDPLTGLPNRYSLKKRLAELIGEAEHSETLVALLIVDLDRFKEVNDTLGHNAGDLLLNEIGHRLNLFLSQHGGVVSRLGGDEFAVVFAGLATRDEAQRKAEAVLQLMQEPFEIEEINVEVGASVGISIFPAHGNTPAQLLRCADVALYVAKHQMKRAAFYEPSHDPHTPKRLALMSGLSTAIREDHFVLHYQPKLSLDNDELAGFEVLLRWIHAEHGMIMPADFIHFAEMGELIAPLTYRVLEKTLSQWRIWADQGFTTALACNLSPRLLIDENLPSQIEKLLATYGVDPACLELEITETALIADPERALEILNRISALGVRLSIDDYGTGYSSLALLKRLPINALKIDLLFVSQMIKNNQDAVIVNSTINLAHNLGLEVIAEGVENRETLETLRAMGCDYAQGFYIGMPVPPQGVELFMANSKAGPVAQKAKRLVERNVSLAKSTQFAS